MPTKRIKIYRKHPDSTEWILMANLAVGRSEDTSRWGLLDRLESVAKANQHIPGGLTNHTVKLTYGSTTIIARWNGKILILL